MPSYTRFLLVFAVVLICGTQSLIRGQAPATKKDRPASNEGHHEHAEASGVTRAICILQSTGDNKVSGVVHFAKKGSHIEIRGTIKGLTPGKHGFHVHEFGDLSDRMAGQSAGGHFNPHKKPHGKQEDDERHVGDLGNIEANADGVAQIKLDDHLLKFDGPTSILGRSLVVHAGEDKFTQPVGDAGGRVAFGVIGAASPEQDSKSTKKK